MTLRLACACACVLALVSCLDSREEIWIRADASGKALITLHLPEDIASLHGGAAGIRNQLLDYFESTPAFTSHAVETSAENERLRIEASFTFDNAMDLVEATAPGATKALPPGAEGLMPETKVGFEGLTLVFKRRAELFKAVPGAAFIPKAQLQGHELTTIIHLPEAARTHNANSTRNKGRTLIWQTPLGVALRQPVENHFIMPLPIPWLPIGVTASLLLLIIAGGSCYFLRNRRRAKKGTAI